MVERIQDFLKPNKNAKTNQGTFIPSNPEKYIGDVNQIYFRSGWELEYYQFCDRTPEIIKYSVESVHVQYINPIDKKPHRYFIDVYMEISRPDGSHTKWLIEIKPEKYTIFPKRPKKETKSSMRNYTRDYNTTLINIEKFRAAKYYSKQLGASFGVVSKDKKTCKFSLVEWDERLIRRSE